MSTSLSSWSSFRDFVEVARESDWQLKEREVGVAPATQPDGGFERALRDVIVPSDGPLFEAQQSRSPERGGSYPTSKAAALLAVKAVAWLPVLADSSGQARALLRDLLDVVGEAEQRRIHEVLDAQLPPDEAETRQREEELRRTFESLGAEPPTGEATGR